MDAIYIPQLTRLPDRTVKLSFEEFLPDLDTLTPVKGWLQVKHQGNYLEVAAQAETIITLACHRCLQNFNYRLTVDNSELIWLSEPSQTNSPGLEEEVAFEDLVESLSPQGHFQPADWLYQQLCLELPQQQLCSKACGGIQLSQVPEPIEERPKLDRRWASLEALKQHFPGQ